MNLKIRDLLVNNGLYTTNDIEQLEDLIIYVINSCISEISIINLSNQEYPDIVWTTNKSIELIKNKFGLTDEL